MEHDYMNAWLSGDDDRQETIGYRDGYANEFNNRGHPDGDSDTPYHRGYMRGCRDAELDKKREGR